VSKPYRDSLRGVSKFRIFEESVEGRELVWHRDAKDRSVTIIKSNGWQLQLENSLPIDLIENVSYFIEKDEWHRLLKGRGDLIIRVEEF
jgi:hypothetical protein